MTLRSLLAGIALGLMVAGAVGCSKEGAADLDDLVEGWKKAGLEPSKFTKVESGGLGGTCRAGTVGGLETRVCEYSDEAKAKLAQTAGLETLGDIPTGVSIAEGRLLLVVSDRQSVDPSGKKIAEITKVFRAK